MSNTFLGRRVYQAKVGHMCLKRILDVIIPLFFYLFWLPRSSSRKSASKSRSRSHSRSKSRSHSSSRGGRSVSPRQEERNHVINNGDAEEMKSDWVIDLQLVHWHLLVLIMIILWFYTETLLLLFFDTRTVGIPYLLYTV